ncbi:MAG TPA: isocitrate/isopropylmalate family dehydrogenase, partial [Armatimonadota bacterium]|nr:isocitrate/isopropylmalate family dehydrogenase [Armatimonadota bacterium]
MAYRVTLIPGDGTGPDVSAAARRCVDATGVEVDWEVLNAGIDVMDEFGTPLPEHVLDSIRANGIALK